ncbi:MAG: putative DNA binding domain-containing protein [Williamsia sp.]|nr:putative DNA binding domain-containing protein [Williamsia sp.]
MNASELELLIQQGEGYNLEFKQSLPSKASDLAEEICAFANAAGGTLLIGVDDKGKIVGVSLDNTNRSRLQNILKTIEPEYPAILQEVSVHGKTVLCIQCQSGEQKPYTVSGAIIIRNGPNSEKITSVQRMRDFFQKADRIFFDEAPCSGFKYPEDFDEAFFRDFTATAGISTTLDTRTILENLKLFADGKHFKNGAVLFFGKEPQKFFEWAATRCVLFKGLSKTHIIDDKLFYGNLVNQYNEALKYIYSKLQVEYIIEDAGPRKEVWELPDVAIKEALINALSHRDYYERGARITVEIFDDRVDIVNPGGLVDSIPKSEFGKRSLSRNSLVFGLFQRMDLVEQVGSGIKRMNDAMKEADLQPPEFNTEGMFVVTFYRPVGFEKWLNYWSPFLNTPQVKVLLAIHDKSTITKPQLSDVIGQGKTSVENYIEQLRAKGILSRSGSRKTGQWVIHQIPWPKG